MGFTPQQVDAMSMWQWFAALDGFIRANTAGGDKQLSEDEADALFDWIDGDSGARMLSTMTYRLDEAGALVPAGRVDFEV